MKTLIEALADPDLFGGMFDAPSWQPWRVFLKALQALPMDEAELAIYSHHTARAAPPARPARYAELVVGRRGGKSRILGLIAVYLACVLDHSPYIVPGETPVIAIIAKDRPQAKVILSYVAGFLRAIDLFAGMIEDELAESVRLVNGVVVEVHTASIGAPRGRTFLAVMCDETAFWPSMGDSANPDVEVINAVRPGLSTIPYSLLLIASSPYARRGILYTNYAKHFGVADAPVLVWQGSTEEMNCSLAGDPLIAEMYAEDPERASAEFGAQFRSDIVAFITREAVEEVLARGVRELPPSGGITYVGHVDPSGGSADSMTLAVAHVEADGLAVLDCIREVKPPFSPDAVVEEFAAVLKSYRIARVTGDAYAGEWPRERFAVHGIDYDVSKKNTSSIYGEFLPALNAGRVRLLDLPRLTGQLVGLERKTARGGRDSISHPPGGHDDVANVACGALVQVIEDRRPPMVARSQLLTAEQTAAPVPSVVQYVFAVAAADPEGNLATVFYAAPVYGEVKLLVVDFDPAPSAATLFHDAHARLAHLQTSYRCQHDAAHVFTSADLIGPPGSARAGVTAVPPEFMEPGPGLMIRAAQRIGGGEVKLCAAALERSRGAPLAGAFDFRSGDHADTPLRLALVWGIALGLEDAPARR